MKNQQVLLVLVSLFVFRLILLSGSYSDAMCLMSLLAYLLGCKVLESRRLEENAISKITKFEEVNNRRLQELADELIKVKNSGEGIKAALNLNGRR